uniref:P22AR C-terminal domain-containing protein n=1 Tax=Photorhabdus sp. RM322S TaxID=3342825 RepID=UPI0036D9D0CE
MNALVNQISAQNLQAIIHSSIPVITTELLAELYGTEINNIQQNFKRNNDRFTHGKHYFKIEGSDLKELKNRLTGSQSVAKRARSLMLWRNAVEMISSISDVYPILRAAEHKLAGKYYSMPREYPRNMNIVRRLLERETAHIECASFTGSDWRVLHSLRIPNSPFQSQSQGWQI